MYRRGAALWDRLSFGARMLATASATLFLAGALLLGVSVRQEAADARSDLVATLGDELRTLPPLLAEVVVVGDYASLRQILDRYVEREQIATAEFIDDSGKSVGSADRPLPSLAPRWFVAALRFHDISGTTPLRVGGRDYGVIAITLTAQAQADRTWLHLLDRTGLLLLAATFGFLAVWTVLRAGLAPLGQLEAGADAIAGGSWETRLAVAGSPELRHLISAFNRMAAATQAALEQQRQSNADLTRFAEVSAHHLMEPTRRLGSYAQRLRSRLAALPQACDDAEAGAALDVLERDAARLRGMVRDIQLYLAAGEARGAVQAESADEVLAAVVARLSPRLRTLGAKIDCAPLPPAVLDRPRLADLFAILLDNALTYGHPADPGVAPQIRVGGERDGKLSRYRICDNGPGVAGQYRERVFEIFERLAAPGGENGSGIGLSIARRIVESRHGRIWIAGDPQGGAVVTFELPDGEET